MTTFTNQTKNSVTPGQTKKAGYGTWGDTVATWGDALITWGAPTAVFVNVSKNSISPTNQTKN